jgi:hypothetical protein
MDQKAFIRQPGLSHLDSFVWTTELSAIYRDFSSGPKVFVRLPGLCKNSFQRVPQTATQLNRRAVSLHMPPNYTKTITCLVFAVP